MGSDGRRPIYLVGTPLLCLGSIGVASAQNIPQLMIWRFVQAIGASPGLAVGSGVIGDIYKLEERGQAMGIFFSVSLIRILKSPKLCHLQCDCLISLQAVLLGPALAPLAGGKDLLTKFELHVINSDSSSYLQVLQRTTFLGA